MGQREIKGNWAGRWIQLLKVVKNAMQAPRGEKNYQQYYPVLNPVSKIMIYQDMLTCDIVIKYSLYTTWQH